jgi:hypothetical protein
MKSHTLSSEKMPFYQKVLNLTLGIGNSPRHSVADESPVASSPFRRGYTRHSVAHPSTPVTPSPIGTPVKSSASSAAASIFRSFRRRSLRRSFRRTKSFLVKNPTGTLLSFQPQTHLHRTQSFRPLDCIHLITALVAAHQVPPPHQGP